MDEDSSTVIKGDQEEANLLASPTFKSVSGSNGMDAVKFFEQVEQPWNCSEEESWSSRSRHDERCDSSWKCHITLGGGDLQIKSVSLEVEPWHQSVHMDDASSICA